MSFKDELIEKGVAVFKGKLNTNAWAMEVVDKDGFLAAAVKSGIAYHEDLSDVEVKGEKQDRERFVTSFGGLIILYEAKNE